MSTLRNKKFILSSLMLAFLFLISFGFTALARATGSDPSVTIAAKNLAFQDNVYIIYAVKTENIETEDLNKVQVLLWNEEQVSYEKGTEDALCAYSDVITNSSAGLIGGVRHRIFVYDKLSAKQMAKTVYARPYFDNDGVAVYGDVVSYSILKYAENKLASSTTSDGLKKLLRTMLAYGAAAEDQFYGENEHETVKDSEYYGSLTGTFTFDRIYNTEVSGEFLSIHTADQEQYLTAEDVKTSNTGYLDNRGEFIFKDGKSEQSLPASLLISWDSELSIGEISYFTVRVSEYSSMKNAYLEKVVTEPQFDVGREGLLKLDTRYYYTVTAHGDGFELTSSVRTFKTAATPVRNLYVNGVTNVRDLGGWETAAGTYSSGGKIKQGLLYRSGRLDSITSAGVEKIGLLGIKSEIDLRETSDSARANYDSAFSNKFAGTSLVNYYNYPLDNNGVIDSLSNATRLNRAICNGVWDTGYASSDIRKGEHDSIIDVFKALADSNNYPVLFHCSIGRDRTGLIAFLVEGLLGVSEMNLYRDYEFSPFANVGGSVSKYTIHYYLNETVVGDKNYLGINSASGATLSDKFYNFLLAYYGEYSDGTTGITATDLDSIINILAGPSEIPERVNYTLTVKAKLPYVISGDGTAVARTEFTFTNAETGEVYEARSNANGVVKLIDVIPGTYTVSADGVEDSEIAVSAAGSGFIVLEKSIVNRDGTNAENYAISQDENGADIVFTPGGEKEAVDLDVASGFDLSGVTAIQGKLSVTIPTMTPGILNMFSIILRDASGNDHLYRAGLDTNTTVYINAVSTNTRGASAVSKIDGYKYMKLKDFTSGNTLVVDFVLTLNNTGANGTSAMRFRLSKNGGNTWSDWFTRGGDDEGKTYGDGKDNTDGIFTGVGKFTGVYFRGEQDNIAGSLTDLIIWEGGLPRSAVVIDSNAATNYDIKYDADITNISYDGTKTTTSLDLNVDGTDLQGKVAFDFTLSVDHETVPTANRENVYRKVGIAFVCDSKTYQYDIGYEVLSNGTSATLYIKFNETGKDYKKILKDAAALPACTFTRENGTCYSIWQVRIIVDNENNFIQLFWRMQRNTGEWDDWCEVSTGNDIGSTTRVTTVADVSRIYFRTTSEYSLPSSETSARRNDMVFSITDLKLYVGQDANDRITEWTE